MLIAPDQGIGDETVSSPACIRLQHRPHEHAVAVSQWTLVVASVNVQWPAILAGPYLAVAWFFASSNTSTGLDCLLANREGGLALPVAKIILGLLMPAALLLVLLCMDAVSMRVLQAVQHRRQARENPVFNVSASVSRRRALPPGVFMRTTAVLIFFFCLRYCALHTASWRAYAWTEGMLPSA